MPLVGVSITAESQIVEPTGIGIGSALLKCAGGRQTYWSTHAAGGGGLLTGAGGGGGGDAITSAGCTGGGDGVAGGGDCAGGPGGPSMQNSSGGQKTPVQSSSPGPVPPACRLPGCWQPMGAPALSVLLTSQLTGCAVLTGHPWE